MARTELLVSLVKAGATGDRPALVATVEAITAEARARNHHILAERLERALSSSVLKPVSPQLTTKLCESLVEVRPRLQLSDLSLPARVLALVQTIILEQMNAGRLRAHGIQPRHKLLLVGPPGNGKTSLAECIAAALDIPLRVVRYEALIGSFLGETNARLARLFDAAQSSPCVLFFDEFDAVGKERGDRHETGEIKRVVSSLLTQIDALGSSVIVIAATNHPELLDRAVWRRFEVRIELPMPDETALTAFFNKTLQQIDPSCSVMGNDIVRALGSMSFAEASEFAKNVLRRMVLATGPVSVHDLVHSEIAACAEQVMKPNINAERSDKAVAQTRRPSSGRKNKRSQADASAADTI